MQVASDVIRDGLGLELLDGTQQVVARVFRCDRDLTVTVRVFDKGVPAEVLTELVDRARHRLGPFEDGTALPAKFGFEDAV